MDFSRIKNFAKKKVKEQFGMALLLTLIVYAITAIPSSVAMFSAATAFLLTPAFSISLINIYISILAGNKPDFKQIFSGFEDWWSAVKLNLFMTLRVLLWSLLFLIPGIIKAIAYSQAMYILSGNPGMNHNECLAESDRLMDGHKMRYFKLQLSFIGWWLLCGVTFGIATIWVIPYYNATMATFYIDIMPSTSENDDTPNEEPPRPERPKRPITFGNSTTGEETKF